MAKQIYIKTLQEAAKIMPMLSVIWIGLALKQGNDVILVDEHDGIEYIFKHTIKEE